MVTAPRGALLTPAGGSGVCGWCEDGPGAGAPLLVAFAGMPDDVLGPRFEFRGLRRRLGTDRVHGLFLRDDVGPWYLDRVAGASGDLLGLVG